MEGEDKGLPERNNKDDQQSGVGDGTDQKEGMNKEDVIEIGGSSEMGMQKSDKESEENKVDDETDDNGSELVGSSVIENAKTAQGMILEPNKTRGLGLQRINDDGSKVDGGGTDDDSQSNADEFSKNDDLGVQKSDQKEGKKKEDVDDGVTETGGSSDMGMQESDKESGKSKVDDGSADDHLKKGKNVKMDNVAGIEIGGSSVMGMQKSDELNKTRKINEDGMKVKGGGNDGGDIQSKADELGKNDDLGVQENVGSGTNNNQDENENVGSRRLTEHRRLSGTVEKLDTAIRGVMHSLYKEKVMIKEFLKNDENVIQMDIEEIREHLTEHQRIKLGQERAIRHIISLPRCTEDMTSKLTTLLQRIEADRLVIDGFIGRVNVEDVNEEEVDLIREGFYRQLNEELVLKSKQAEKLGVMSLYLTCSIPLP